MEHGAPHPFSSNSTMLGFAAAGACASCPNIEWEDDMADSVYKVIQLIRTSKESLELAAVVVGGRASKALRDLRVAEVDKLDLQLDAKGKIEAYRAKLNVSFKFERS